MNTTEKIAVVRDQILFFGGLAGIAYQQLTGDVNFVLLGIFTAMTGVPGLTNFISLLRGSLTESPSLQQAPPPQPSESDNSSTNS